MKKLLIILLLAVGVCEAQPMKIGEHYVYISKETGEFVTTKDSAEARNNGVEILLTQGNITPIVADTGKVFFLSEYELIGFRYFESGYWMPELKKKEFPAKDYEPVIINGDTAFWREKREIKVKIPLNETPIFRKNPKKEGEGQGGQDSLKTTRLTFFTPKYKGKLDSDELFDILMMFLDDYELQLSEQLYKLNKGIETGSYSDIKEREVMKLRANDLLKKLKLITKYKNAMVGREQSRYDQEEYEVNESLIWPNYDDVWEGEMSKP